MGSIFYSIPPNEQLLFYSIRTKNKPAIFMMDFQSNYYFGIIIDDEIRTLWAHLYASDQYFDTHTHTRTKYRTSTIQRHNTDDQEYQLWPGQSKFNPNFNTEHIKCQIPIACLTTKPCLCFLRAEAMGVERGEEQEIRFRVNISSFSHHQFVLLVGSLLHLCHTSTPHPTISR